MRSFLVGCGVVAGCLVILLIVLGASWMGSYNALNSADQGQQKLWGDIESTMQRRSDLVPNLVSTVKGYAKHEATVFTNVTEARSKVGQVNFNLARTNPEEMAKLKMAESELSGALSRLLVVAENYPQLKASEGFLNLQSQLEGTENRINVARERYNGGVESYNRLVGSAWTGLVARVHGFQKAEYFKADAKAKEVPKVSFE